MNNLEEVEKFIEMYKLQRPNEEEIEYMSRAITSIKLNQYE